MPAQCPPKEAHPPKGESYYRLTLTFPPKEEDFVSARQLQPDGQFRADECHARALSVFTCPKECEKMRKLPLQNKKRFVVEISLPPESGEVERFGSRKAHYSLWLRKGFDPVSCAKQHKVL